MEKLMIIMRGIPGSGKSTIAKLIQQGLPNSIVLSTDDLFMTPEGVYNFDPKKLGINHKQNQSKAMKACEEGKNVIIDNTNTKQSEVNEYVKIAQQYGYKISVVSVLEQQPIAFKRNSHGVPEETHKRLHNQLINSINEEYQTKEELPNYL